MAKHRGVREFTGEEMGNLSSGQAGFKIISNAEVECGVTSGYTDCLLYTSPRPRD